MELTEEFQQFVADHRQENAERLRLKYHGKAPWIDMAVTHIHSLQKAGRKFIDPVTGEDFTPRLMLFPLSVEQATSAVIARHHQTMARCGERVLDMTCGLGIDSMMLALVPGVRLTTCEMNPPAAEAARFNFAEMTNVEVIEGDSVAYLERSDEKFDLIFIDPARRDSGGGRVYNIRQCTPDVTAILPLMMRKAKRICIKLSPMIDLKQTRIDLGVPCRIHCVDDGHECKELLVEIDCVDPVKEETVVVNDDKRFIFTSEEEENAEVAYATSDELRAGMILHEPSPAAMRSGAFRLMSQRFGLTKLHPNTHIYLGMGENESFPGKRHVITDVIELSSSAIKRLNKTYPRLNVAVRNYPGSPEEFLKKAKIRQGGDLKGFAVTTGFGKYLVICRSVSEVHSSSTAT